MNRLRLCGLAIALGAAACGDATAPDPGRVVIEPPARYQQYWHEVESCSGIQGSFTQVRWFLVHEFAAGEGILGQWNGRREITIRSDVWLEREVVAHEILHDLLAGDRDHVRPEWDACGLDTGLPEG